MIFKTVQSFNVYKIILKLILFMIHDDGLVLKGLRTVKKEMPICLPELVLLNYLNIFENPTLCDLNPKDVNSSHFS